MTTQKEMMAAKGYLTINEAAAMCGLSPDGMYKIVAKLKGKSVKLGKFRYVLRQALVEHFGEEAAAALGLLETPPRGGRRSQ